MSDVAWEVVYETNGMLLAEILRGMLEAQEIPVVLSQEGAGKVYGLTVGTLGKVEILVPDSEVERAERILEDYETNNLEIVDPPDADFSDPGDQGETDEDLPA